MLFHYSWLNDNGNKEEADIEATSLDNAIVLVQNKGLKTILEVKEKDDKEQKVIHVIKGRDLEKGDNIKFDSLTSYLLKYFKIKLS